jgi:hypothetical protein
LSLVGWGGLGPANVGAANTASAAASEPAKVALAMTFLEFIEFFLCGTYLDVTAPGSKLTLRSQLAKQSDDLGEPDVNASRLPP